MIRKRVVYSGRVQGVGFRYTTQRLAEGFAVSGYVRNLPGGNVELVAEGKAAEIEPFLEAVARQMVNYIKGHTIHDEPPSGHTEFVIRH